MTNLFKKLFVLPLLAFLVLAFYGLNAKTSVFASSSFSKARAHVISEEDVKMDDLLENLLKSDFEALDMINPDAEVWTIVNLKSDTLFESFRKTNLDLSYAEFLDTAAGQAALERVKNDQEKAKEAILKVVPNAEFKRSYSSVTNGFAAKITYRDFAKLSELKEVESINISVVYELDDEHDYDTSVVDVSTLDGAKSDKYRGAGTVIGILDTGLQVDHTAFSVVPDVQAFNKDYIAEALNHLNAYQLMDGELSADDLYQNGKVPFAFDYADGDADVNPDFTNIYQLGNEHGTHVAGIAAGNNGEGFEGGAPDAQLAIFKVFSDSSNGAASTDIIAALDDALVLGVDVVNLSLGSPCGFDYSDDTKYYDALRDAGIIVTNSAGNDYNSGMGTTYSYGTVENPDQATIGTAASYEACIAVASYATENQKEPAIIVGGVAALFTEAVKTQEPEVRGKFVEELVGDAEDVEFGWAYIGTGTPAEVASVDVNGKIAVVLRGDISFAEKAYYAEQAGAVACVIMNNVGGIKISPVIENADFPVTIPVCSISKEDGEAIVASSDPTAHVGSSIYKLGGTLNEFSAWGPTPTLKLKPEITAYGGYVYSALATEAANEYACMSGTSMSAPNLAGNMAVMKEYLANKLYGESYEDVDLLRMADRLIMSTATILYDSTNGVEYSPRRQGAGLININAATSSPAYISVAGQDKAKIELGEDEKRTGEYELKFAVNNFSKNVLSFKLDPVVLTTTLQADGYQLDKISERIEDSLFEFEGKGNGVVSSNGFVQVDAKGVVEVTVKITLSDDRKDYFDTNYPYGTYVEGFVKLEALDEYGVNLSVPYLGFYGNWDEAPVLDYVPGLDDRASISYDTALQLLFGNGQVIPAGMFPFNTNYEYVDGNLSTVAFNPLSQNSLWGIYSVYLSLLRNVNLLKYDLYDAASGELLKRLYGTQIRKACLVEGDFRPVAHALQLSPYLYNNQRLKFVVDTEIASGGYTFENAHSQIVYDLLVDAQRPYVDGIYSKTYDIVNGLDGVEPFRIVEEDGEYFVEYTLRDNGYLLATDFRIQMQGRMVSLFGMMPAQTFMANDSYTVSLPLDLIAAYAESNTFQIIIYDTALNGTQYTVELPVFPVEEVSFEQAELELAVNETGELPLVLNPSYGYYDSLTFTSANEEVVTVDEEGAVAALAVGESEVTATLVVDETELTATILVKVVEAAPEPDPEPDPDPVNPEPDPDPVDPEPDPEPEPTPTYTFEKEEYIVRLGETAQLNMVADMDVEEMPTFTFVSTDTNIFTVNANNEIVPVAEGSAIVVALDESFETVDYVDVRVCLASGEWFISEHDLLGYSGSDESVIIPEEVEYIYSNVFEGSPVKNLYIPSTVKYIADEVFAESSLVSVEFAPNTSLELGPYLFGLSEELEYVVLPEGMTVLPEGTFFGCTGLLDVVLPSTLKDIEESAFEECYSLGALTGEFKLPDHVAYVGPFAFASCISIERFILSEELKYLAGVNYGDNEYAYSSYSLTSVPFADLEGLVEYVLPETNEYFKVVDGVLYNHSGSLLISYPAAKEDTEFTVPFGVSKIAASAFAYAGSLRKVTLPFTLAAIGEYAFYGTRVTQYVFTSPVAPALETGTTNGVYFTYGNLTRSIGSSRGYSLYNFSIVIPEDSFGYDGIGWDQLFGSFDYLLIEDAMKVENFVLEQTDEGVKGTFDGSLGAVYTVTRTLGEDDGFADLVAILFPGTYEFVDDTAKALFTEYTYVISPVVMGANGSYPGEPVSATITREAEVDPAIVQLIATIKELAVNADASTINKLKSAYAQYTELTEEEQAMVGLGDVLENIYNTYLYVNDFNIYVAQATKPDTFDESYALINEINEDYESLTEEEQKFVTVSKIINAWNEDINKVRDLIFKLQFFGTVTLESGPAIAEVKAQYAALTPYQKKIANATYSATIAKIDGTYASLLEAEAKAAQERNINSVITLIENLPSTVTTADYSLVDAAKAAYDALSDYEKSKVPAALVEKLDSIKASDVPAGCTISLGAVIVSSLSALSLAAIFFKKRNF